jgi:hypothetical protein
MSIVPPLALAAVMALDNDTLVMEPNTFHETLNFPASRSGCSQDPNNPGVVAATIIDAANPALSVVGFGSGETQ